MPFLKNNSLRIIYVGDSMILPGATSDELPDEVMGHSGVKALMASRELSEVDDPEASQEPKARAPQPQPKPAQAAPEAPKAPPPPAPPADKK